MMISIVLGLLVLAGLTVFVVNNVTNTDQVERTNQQIENGRYAMQLIMEDFQNAGYLAEFNPSVLTAPASKPDPCAVDLTTLNSALPLAVQGYYQGASAPTCLSDVKANTAIFVIRRASTCAVGDTGCDALIANAPYLQASSCNSTSELGSTSTNYSTNYYALDTTSANLTRHLKDCTTLAPMHQYFTRIYFVANNDKPSDGIPTLKRAELGNAASPGGFTIVPLVEGIEDLQIQYGLDNPTSPTGSPTVFTPDPDSYNSCSSLSTPTCTAYWQNTVAVKINLLARAPTSTTGYSSSKTYNMGLDSAGNPITRGPYSDSYERHQYETTVRLNNLAGRNTP
jgi:type IV pilus assembly protein PilW